MKRKKHVLKKEKESDIIEAQQNKMLRPQHKETRKQKEKKRKEEAAL